MAWMSHVQSRPLGLRAVKEFDMRAWKEPVTELQISVDSAELLQTLSPLATCFISPLASSLQALSYSTMVDTVKFNVSGRHFEVSRALIDEHSETVLGKLVSDTWNGHTEEAIFVDRNGEMFAQVLEYLRYGSIELPISIPRSMFERELDYYGITSVEGITDQGTVPTLLSFTQPVVRAKKNLAEAQRRLDLFTIAYECQSTFCEAILNKHEAVNARLTVSKRKYNVDLGGNDRTLLDLFLETHFGLAVCGITTDRHGDYFYVEVARKK